MSIATGLAHAKDATGTDIDAGLANMRQRVETVLEGPRRDDVAVELRRGIEIVIVSVKTSFFQALCLGFRKHTKRTANFQPNFIHPFHHFDHFIDAVYNVYPVFSAPVHVVRMPEFE